MLAQGGFALFLELLHVVDKALVTIDFEFLVFLNFVLFLLLLVDLFVDYIVYGSDVGWSFFSLFYTLLELRSQSTCNFDSSWVEEINIAFIDDFKLARISPCGHSPLFSTSSRFYGQGLSRLCYQYVLFQKL